MNNVSENQSTAVCGAHRGVVWQAGGEAGDRLELVGDGVQGGEWLHDKVIQESAHCGPDNLPVLLIVISCNGKAALLQRLEAST